MIRLVSLYACSGFLALVYEVLWMRLLSIQFGVSAFAVVVTVAAFMMGLGLGAWRFSTASSPVMRSSFYLGWIECGLSIFAIFLPTLVRLTTPFIDSAALRFSDSLWHVLIFLAALILLSIPAYAMGAGFSLVLRYVGNQAKALPWIYGFNTLGGVLGALWPLWALPTFGWVASLRIAALFGLLLAFGFWFVLPKGLHNKKTKPPTSVRPPLNTLIKYGALGALSLALEVAWTRLFGLIMLRTEYVLALVLATFLLGIAIGSVLTSQLGRFKWLNLLPWLVATGIALSLIEWIPVSAYLESAQFSGFYQALLVQGLLMLAMTLPVTLSLGAWLPLLAKQYHNSGQWLYSVNALGGAVGALITGFVLIPLWGTTPILGLIAFLFILLDFKQHNKLWWAIIPVAAGVLLWISQMPATSRLLPQELGHSKDLYHYEDAIAMTEVVEQPNGQRYLLTDLQRRDASSEPTAVLTQENQVYFPLLYQGNPHSLLLLGLGTGISDEGSLPFSDLTRTAVELSRGAIIGAKSWFSALNQETLKQTSIIQDDARHFLSAHTGRYDVIVGDLFHPDLAGVSSLLSLQQFQRVRQHLDHQGVFVQWLALNQFDLSSFEVILTTFKRVFPEGVMFMDGMHLALVGSADNNTLDSHGLFTSLPTGSLKKEFLGESKLTWSGRYMGIIPDSPVPVQDEWAPVIEFTLPRLHYTNSNELPKILAYLMANRPPLAQAKKELSVPVVDSKNFEASFIATDFLVRSWLATFSGQDGEAAHLIELAYQANPQDRWIQYALSDQLFANQKNILSHGLDEKTLLQRILSINPYHVEAWRSLWHLQQVEKDPDADHSLAELLQLSPLDLEANSAKNRGL
ncbi:MAG: hypothetical protein B7Z65_01090 [Ferrovum sp. 21-44-67]|nr:MAG: hypothetical protein B7Z65_01090 [Ferrovum sp. 21-44-67]HQU06092.1 hypothetical protein [Ferrovaceae bacterium]